MSNLIHKDSTSADSSTDDNTLNTSSEVQVGAEDADIFTNQIPDRIVISQTLKGMHVGKVEALSDRIIGAQTLKAVSVEGTVSAKAVVFSLFQIADRDANMTSFWMHHSMNTLAVDDESNTNSRAYSHVADGLLDVGIILVLSLDVLKHSGHVNICVKEDFALTFLSIEAETSGHFLVNIVVLPGELRRRRDAAVLS